MDDMKKALFIEGNRNGYHPNQCYRTMTLRRLINQLEEYAEEYGGTCEVYLKNDGGYTYGSIGISDFSVGCYDGFGVYDEESDEFGEFIDSGDFWNGDDYEDEEE